MSRIKRSNRNKKNNELKKILGLALAIGIVGTSTSYAYFSSKADIFSNLKITMGTLDLNLECDYEEGEDKKGLINITGLKPSLKDDDCECETDDQFKIENTGSLKQKIKIKIDFYDDNDGDDYRSILKYLIGDLVLENKSTKQVSKSITVGELSSGGFIEVLEKDSEKPLVIKPGETLIGTFGAKVKNSIDYKNEDKELDFDITVRGTQVNNKDWKGIWPKLEEEK